MVNRIIFFLIFLTCIILSPISQASASKVYLRDTTPQRAWRFTSQADENFTFKVVNTGLCELRAEITGRKLLHHTPARGRNGLFFNNYSPPRTIYNVDKICSVLLKPGQNWIVHKRMGRDYTVTMRLISRNVNPLWIKKGEKIRSTRSCFKRLFMFNRHRKFVHGAKGYIEYNGASSYN